jgi:hypothetical protein
MIWPLLVDLDDEWLEKFEEGSQAGGIQRERESTKEF